MKVRGIRGATTVEVNEEEAILTATRQLLEEIVEHNKVLPEDIASVFITATSDLTATFPAMAIRRMPDWEAVPLMCATEIDVPGSLPLCIRLLLHANTDRGQKEIRHVYLREARNLRPDLTTP
ncbi:chorismate mutase [Marininema halotolerans]|uniref:chorismate mutase n=1 Tax=Marininema halotolerans TaxID=1155944 RepID=A0A1I6TZ85_9BACL|nr:chorismate mutase [Marininema halotolerans]SFS94511.1 chorismate mutase [Marininema halotolerans]